MMLRVFLFLPFVLLGVDPSVYAQDWEPLGPNDWNWPSVGKAYYPRLAVDANNNPILLAKDYGEDGGYHVRRWDGAKWIALGSDGFFSDGALLSNMVLDEAGNPVLAGTDPSNEDRLMVRRWNGTSWVSVGAEGISSADITSLSLAKDASGRYVVAYGNGPWDRRIIVKRWSGSDWENIGDENFSDPGAYYGVSLALDPSGNPVVAYQANPGIHLTRVQRWTGSVWEALPPINLGNYPVDYAGIVVDDDGFLMVVLSNWMLGHRPVVERWNGMAWETLGPVGISAGNCSSVDLDIDMQGRPVLFYSDYTEGTLIRRWDGSNWEIVCVLDTAHAVSYPRMVLASNGDYFIAGQSGWLGMRSHVLRWNGSEWLEYGERGFSSMGAYYTSLAMNSTGEIAVAYSDPSLGTRTVVQRWNGQSWELVGLAGVSAGHAAYHALVLDSVGYPIVAYKDYVHGGISVKYWNGSVWGSLGAEGFDGVNTIGMSLAITSGSVPVLAYKIPIGVQDYYRVNVVTWDEASWNNIGQFPYYWASGELGFDLDSRGFPCIGFHDTSLGGPRVLRWNGQEWTALPTFMCCQSGSSFQSLVFDKHDNVIIASNGTLRQWDGESWEVIGTLGDVAMNSIDLEVSEDNQILAGGLEFGRATVRRWNGRYWQGVGSARFTTSFSDLQGPKWLQTDGHGKVVVAYTNGGMYAKSIQYSDEGIFIRYGVLNLGPNPNTGEELWISLAGLPGTSERVEVELFDMSGRRVGAEFLPVTHGELNSRLSLPTGLADGMYIVSVSSDSSRWSARLVVAKQ